MASELTPKQERFALAYIETGNASEAYRQAYDAGNMKPETIWARACELLKNSKVAARVSAIQKRHRIRHEVTVDSITTELEEARRMALDTTQPSAAISASLGKAKLHGLITDKAQINAEVELTGKVSIYLPDNGRSDT